ncbi:MAG: hypothetical protein AAB354_07895 [candidate division KSB1 bacterium]
MVLSLLSAARFNANANEPNSFTHTNAYLTPERLTLEVEVLPHMLQQARVLRDRDGKMSQAEFDLAKAEILAYAQPRLGVRLNARSLRADSAAVIYRFQETAAAPSCIYITCWYALLLQPEHLQIRNDMFQELAARHRNYGTIANGKLSVDFEFPANAPENEGAQFELAANKIVWLNANDKLSSPALLWLGAGVGGLVLLAGMAYLRKLARRRARRQKRTQRAAMGTRTSTTSVAPVARRHAYQLEKALS